jgi:hypothetical protein
MASAVEICNLALSHLGHTKRISSFTEQSEEARLCSIFYEIVRDIVLREYKWPFASVISALGLVEEDPNDEWSYSYRYPSDCLDVRRILGGLRNDTRESRVPYLISQDSSGRILYCDIEDAFIEYTKREDDTSFYPPDFVMALSYRIASYLAPALTGGDPYGLQQKTLQLYQIEISRASSSSFNEQQDEQLPQSEFINARE